MIRKQRFFGTAIGLCITTSALAQDGGVFTPLDGRAETVITASRTAQRADEATLPTEVITRRDIQASGARDLSELLELHPGIDLARYAPVRSTGVRLLGMDPEYVLVLVDGERVPGRVGGAVDLDRFSLRDVERIEIVKGPASVMYGSEAMAGVINLITRQARRPLETEVQAAFGGRGELDFRGFGGVSRPNLDASTGGSFRRADAFDLAPADDITTGSEYSTWDVDARVAAHPSDTVTLGASARYERRDGYGVDGTPAGALFNRRTRDEAFDATVRARWEAAAVGTLSLRAHAGIFRGQYLQDQRQGRDLDQYQDVRELLFEGGLQWDRRVFERHHATAGVDVLDETLRSPRLAPDGIGRRQRIAAFVQDEWRPLDAPRLSASFGVRLDADSQFGLSPSPRVAVRYDPLASLALRAAYGWGFRAPSFQELLLYFENPGVGYVVEGNPALRPERSRGLNVSADWLALHDLALSASAFRLDVEDLIAVVTVADATAETPIRFGYRNVSRAYTQGLELSVRTRLLGFASVDFGYTWMDTRDLDTGLPLEGRPGHRATARLSARYRPWNLSGAVGAALVGPRSMVDRSAPDLRYASDPYLNLDASLRWYPWRFLGLFALASNLLNAGDPIDLPLAPRTFRGGVEARW